MNLYKGSVVKQSGDDVEGLSISNGFVSTQCARISAIQCKVLAKNVIITCRTFGNIYLISLLGEQTKKFCRTFQI